MSETDDSREHGRLGRLFAALVGTEGEVAEKPLGQTDDARRRSGTRAGRHGARRARS